MRIIKEGCSNQPKLQVRVLVEHHYIAYEHVTH